MKKYLPYLLVGAGLVAVAILTNVWIAIGVAFVATLAVLAWKNASRVKATWALVIAVIECKMRSKNLGKIALFWVITMAIYALALKVSFLLPRTDTLDWGVLTRCMLLLHFVLSYKTVHATEVGAKLLFGRILYEQSSGLAFVPLWICTLQKETRLVQQEEYPKDPEFVWKGDMKDIPKDLDEEGNPIWVPPMRVTHAAPKGATKGNGKGRIKANDPINRRMTTEVQAFVRFRITDFPTFLKTIGSIAEAKRQMRDTVIATIREKFAKQTPAETLMGWKGVNKALKRAVHELVDPWGIADENVAIKEVDLGETVNKALRDVPAAQLAREKVEIDAAAKRTKLTLKGKGEAAALQAILAGRAVGYKRIAKELDIVNDGAFVLAAETAISTAEKADYSLIAGAAGFADIYQMAAAIKNVLPKLTKEIPVASSAPEGGE